MTPSSWRSSEVFEILCDQVASDHLVCMTGAGISGGLLRRRRLGRGPETLPGWPQLLGELFASLRTQMPADDSADTERLLSSENIGSDELILAASLIRRANPKKFDRRFRRAITSRTGQYSPTHMQLLDLQPRGIMTFNYDGGHEAALEKASRPYVLLNPVISESELLFRRQIERRLQDFFLLKAHGSTESPAPLVLTTEGYRDLLVRNPAFRSFVQHLFTNFSFLIVGYGLDDPDFNLFIRTMAHEFGGPLQKHVVLRRLEDRTAREEVERHMYGIHTLHMSSFKEIPAVLSAAATTAGPELRRTLESCLSPHQE
ncbi:MAG TPA: SIR2 family protein, partial [Solirubrobacterales bacterium]